MKFNYFVYVDVRLKKQLYLVYEDLKYNILRFIFLYIRKGVIFNISIRINEYNIRLLILKVLI